MPHFHVRVVDCSGRGLFGSWTARVVDCSGRGLLGSWTVLVVDCSGRGLLGSWTVRVVDCSGRGLIGSWTVRVVDCSSRGLNTSDKGDDAAGCGMYRVISRLTITGVDLSGHTSDILLLILTIRR